MLGSFSTTRHQRILSRSTSLPEKSCAVASRPTFSKAKPGGRLSVTSVSLLSVSSFLFFTHIATTATLGIEQQLCMTASLDTSLLLGTRNIRSCS